MLQAPGRFPFWPRYMIRVKRRRIAPPLPPTSGPAILAMGVVDSALRDQLPTLKAPPLWRGFLLQTAMAISGTAWTEDPLPERLFSLSAATQALNARSPACFDTRSKKTTARLKWEGFDFARRIA